MEPDPLWVQEASRSHWLMRERSWFETLGWVVVFLAPAAGILCGLGAIVLTGGSVFSSGFEWLLIPAAVPVAASVAVRKSVLLGMIGGMVSATVAFMTVGALAILQVACFIITFMGDCG